MTSMTGYAYEEITTENAVVSVEIRSVNSRFLDLSINIPPYLNRLESFFRERIIQSVTRGKLDVNIRIRETETATEVIADTKAAKAYFDAISKVSKACGYKTQDVPLSLIISQPGVLTMSKSYDMDSYKTLISPVFEKSLSMFIQDRTREGENLKKDLLKKLITLDECATFFEKWQPQMDEAFKNQITAKFNELLADKADQNRIMTETAAMLVKYTINEEIVRLKSHLKAMRSELEHNPIPGKKLDFICQEANREINTIGSKNQFAEVGAMVIKAKDALENIREQSKNVE